MERYLAAIDIGSSSCKIGLFTISGKQISVIRKNTSVAKANTDTAKREYDPEIWWINIEEALSELAHKVDPSCIKAIGLSGQIGTHLLMDENMRSILPSISWQDNRARKEAEEYNAAYSPALMMKELGMHLPPGVAWPIPRLLWLKKNEPHLFNTGFKMIQVKEFIGWKLTGILKTDVLSLRGLVNPYTLRISPMVKNKILGMPDLEEHLPPFTKDATELLGTITNEIACKTGLHKGLEVYVGCGDFHASLLGTGIKDEKTGFNITGTSDHIGILEVGDKPFNKYRVGKYPSVIPGTNLVYGATSAGGGSVDWFMKNLAVGKEGESLKEYLSCEYGNACNSNGMVFLPYINGERAPIWDSGANGCFMGVTSSHKRAHFLYAVLEGVGFSLRDNWEIINDGKFPDTVIRITGTAAGDRVWNQIKANILKTPVETMYCRETSCLGAAMLAAAGSGEYESIVEALDNMAYVENRIYPDPSTYGYYDDLFAEYCETKKAAKEISHKLNDIRRKACE